MPRRPRPGGAMSIAQFAEELDGVSGAHRRDENFRRLIEAAYCTLAKLTAVDESTAATLQARYMAIVARYQDDPKAMVRMSELFDRMRLTIHDCDGDFLGEAYMAKDFSLRSPSDRQSFTPYHLTQCLSSLELGDREEVSAKISEKGVLRVLDPACGSGGLILAFADRLRKFGFEPEKVMLAWLTDIDALCMQMAFIQMWIHNIPAICIHANTMSGEEFDRAYTAAALRLRWPRGTAAAVPPQQPVNPNSTAGTSPIDDRPSGARASVPPKRVSEQGDLFGLLPTED